MSQERYMAEQIIGKLRAEVHLAIVAHADPVKERRLVFIW
jgi:hypothetical protein